MALSLTKWVEFQGEIITSWSVGPLHYEVNGENVTYQYIQAVYLAFRAKYGPHSPAIDNFFYISDTEPESTTLPQ